MNYAGARYYDAGIGRFVSQDPLFWELPDEYLIDPQQWNSYSYARNNPLNTVDPTGLYNIKTGEVEEGDTEDGIVNAINSAFGIKTDWQTIHSVSFYKDQFQGKSLSDIVGKSLGIGTSITADITNQLNQLNSDRAKTAAILGKASLLMFAPGQGWDIKNSSDSVLGGGTDNRKFWSYIYNGKLIRYDAPGNMNFGYVARSLGLPGFVIQGGAIAQQVVDDRRKNQSISLSDNYGDSQYIKNGINGYKSRLPWWKRLLPW